MMEWSLYVVKSLTATLLRIDRVAPPQRRLRRAVRHLAGAVRVEIQATLVSRDSGWR